MSESNNSIQSSGSVNVSSSREIVGEAYGVNVTAAGNIDNYGTITANSGVGASVDAAGNITNYSGGFIAGSTSGVYISGAAKVENAGSISGVTYGVDLIAASTALNSGSISASGGPGLFIGGAGTITNSIGGSIIGSTFGVNIIGAGTLNNSASIQSTQGIGANIVGAGTFSNGAGASIKGATYGVNITGSVVSGFTNSGTITGGTKSAIYLAAASSVVTLNDTSVINGAVEDAGGGGTINLTATSSHTGVFSSKTIGFTTINIAPKAAWTIIQDLSSLTGSGALTINGLAAASNLVVNLSVADYKSAVALNPTNPFAFPIALPFSVALSGNAADVQGILGTLNSKITAVNITDGAQLILTPGDYLAAAQSVVFGKISGDYTVGVSGDTATISNILENLGADSHVTAIIPTDILSIFQLTLARYTANSAALAKIQNSYGVSVSGSSADIGAVLSTLNSDPHINAIRLTDGKSITLSLAQLAANQTALTNIGSYQLQISDTSTNVNMALDTLRNNNALTSIVLTDTKGLLTVSADQYNTDSAVLAKIKTPIKILVVDSSTNVALILSTLNNDPRISGITFTDTAVAPIGLTVAEYTAYNTALSLITPPYAVVIQDTNANVVASFDKLAIDPNIRAIVLPNYSIISLSAAQLITDNTLLDKIIGPYALKITDTVANVTPILNALSNQGSFNSIALTDSGSFKLSTADYKTYTNVLSTITTPFGVTITDTAANIPAALDALQNDAKVTAYTVSDSGVVGLNTNQFTADSVALTKFTGSYKLAISDTSDNVLTNLDALASNTNIVAVNLTDSGPITLSDTQYAADKSLLDKVVGPFSLTVVPTFVAPPPPPVIPVVPVVPVVPIVPVVPSVPVNTMDSAPAPTRSIPVVTGTLAPGSNSSKNFTSNTVLTGTADANSVVTINNGNVTLGSVVADASGQWNFTPKLAYGNYALTVSEQNTAGNVGFATLNFTVDPILGTKLITPADGFTTAFFDSAYYLKSNPDVAAAITSGVFKSALDHFIRFGQFENRMPNATFNPIQYLANNPDVKTAIDNKTITSAFNHFVSFGANEDRSSGVFSGQFNEQAYLAANPDVALAIRNGQFSTGYQHFLLFGLSEGRSAGVFSGVYNEQSYLIGNPDVAAAVSKGQFSSGLQHYLSFGFKEGRLVAPDVKNSLVIGSTRKAADLGLHTSSISVLVPNNATATGSDASQTNTGNIVSLANFALTPNALTSDKMVFLTPAAIVGDQTNVSTYVTGLQVSTTTGFMTYNNAAGAFSLPQLLAAAESVISANMVVAFEFNGNTYVVQAPNTGSSAAVDHVFQLTGLTGVASLGSVQNSHTLLIG